MMSQKGRKKKKRKCDIDIQWNTTQLKERKSCHMLQHGSTLRTLC